MSHIEIVIKDVPADSDHRRGKTLARIEISHSSDVDLLSLIESVPPGRLAGAVVYALRTYLDSYGPPSSDELSQAQQQLLLDEATIVGHRLERIDRVLDTGAMRLAFDDGESFTVDREGDPYAFAYAREEAPR